MKMGCTQMHADSMRLNELSGRVIRCAFAVLTTSGADAGERSGHALALELRKTGLARSAGRNGFARLPGPYAADAGWIDPYTDLQMGDDRTLDELKACGAGRPAPEEIVRLYHQAFAEFGVQALWSRKASAHPTIAQALVAADGLRREGNMASRALAARIEAACRAAV